MTESIKELTIVREFSVPRELVFKAWTDPKLVAQWWGPNGVTNPICNIDARVGGKIEIEMLAGDQLGELKGSRWPMTGEFIEIDRPKKIVYSASAMMDVNSKPVLDSLNTVTFEEHNGKTKMTLHIKITKAAPGSEGPLAGMEMGWSQSIGKLDAFLNK